jgi:uncharacterized Zn-binding protein involved in type VI secretion
MSPTGRGKGYNSPIETSVGECNSNSVFANGKLIVVSGNQVSQHPKSGGANDDSKLTVNSKTVFIGGQGVGRIGDKYNDNTITQGSENVFSG